MNTPPLTREQQIHLMKTAADRQAKTIARLQADPQVQALLRDEPIPHIEGGYTATTLTMTVPSS